MEMTFNPAFDGCVIGRDLDQMTRCFGARVPAKEITNQILADCPGRISVDHWGQCVKWKEYPGTVDFEHFYLITRGINEALFDCWLSDDSFLLDLLAQVEWAHNLTQEMGIFVGALLGGPLPRAMDWGQFGLRC